MHRDDCTGSAGVLLLLLLLLLPPLLALLLLLLPLLTSGWPAAGQRPAGSTSRGLLAAPGRCG
jgi:hypothetical protein